MEIELYNQIQKSADPMVAIDKMGEWIGRSGLLPISKVEAGKVIALVCLTEGITIIEFLRTYDVMSDGRIRKKSLAALAGLRKKGGSHKWIKTGDDGKEAVLEITYEGQTITSRYTMDDAKKADLVRGGGNWVKTPANMLRARAISNGVAMIAPEIFAGEDDGADDFNGPSLNMKPANPAAAEAIATEKAEPAAPAAKAPTPVIDVPSEKVVQETKQKPSREPTATEVMHPPSVSAPAPAAVQQEMPAAAQPAKGPQLSDEMVAKVEAAIGPENAQKAIAWMFKRDWLKPGMSLYDLPESRAVRILKQRDSFLETILKS